MDADNPLVELLEDMIMRELLPRLDPVSQFCLKHTCRRLHALVPPPWEGDRWGEPVLRWAPLAVAQRLMRRMNWLQNTKFLTIFLQNREVTTLSAITIHGTPIIDGEILFFSMVRSRSPYIVTWLREWETHDLETLEIVINRFMIDPGNLTALFSHPEFRHLSHRGHLLGRAIYKALDIALASSNLRLYDLVAIEACATFIAEDKVLSSWWARNRESIISRSQWGLLFYIHWQQKHGLHVEVRVPNALYIINIDWLRALKQLQRPGDDYGAFLDHQYYLQTMTNDILCFLFQCGWLRFDRMNVYQCLYFVNDRMDKNPEMFRQLALEWRDAGVRGADSVLRMCDFILAEKAAAKE